MSDAQPHLEQIRRLAEEYGGSFEPPEWIVLAMDSAPSGPIIKATPRLLDKAGRLVISTGAATAFFAAADHALVAYFRAEQNSKIEIATPDIRIELDGGYSEGAAKRLFDEAVRARPKDEVDRHSKRN